MFSARGGFFAETVTPEPSNAWDIVFAVYSTDSFSLSSQDSSPQGLTFDTDGTKMYTAGITNDNVYEYDLTSPWDITTATYNQSFSVAAQDGTPTDIAFKTDGTKMFVSGAGNDDIYEYTLSTAWDISTATYVQSFDVSSEETVVLGLYFKPDGTKFYITGSSSDSVHEYDLSSAWDISTASFNQSYSVVGQDGAPQDVYFRPNGVRMYVVGDVNDTIYQYNLSTPWDISTATVDDTLNINAQTNQPRDIAFNDTGTVMVILGGTTLYSYNL